MILAGDVGGTNTRLALFESHEPLHLEVFRSSQYAGLGEIAVDYLARTGATVSGACFGIAGPVRAGVVKTPNLSWVVDARELAGRLGLAQVHLINDLEANAHGIAALQPADFAVLNEGAADAAGGNCALIAAGTGLGQAGLLSDGSGYRVFASEGGHSDFAPRGELEIELLRYLQARWPHVSYERVLSGPGLHNIYEFLRDTGRGSEPKWLTERLNEADPSAVISETGLSARAEICAQALDLFASIYGAEAGNLALKLLATGGVFLGGGIAPKLLGKLGDSVFMRAFVDKGRLRPVLESIPVRVILNDQTALLGAARVAVLRAGARPDGARPAIP